MELHEHQRLNPLSPHDTWPFEPSLHGNILQFFSQFKWSLSTTSRKLVGGEIWYLVKTLAGAHNNLTLEALKYVCINHAWRPHAGFFSIWIDTYIKWFTLTAQGSSSDVRIDVRFWPLKAIPALKRLVTHIWISFYVVYLQLIFNMFKIILKITLNQLMVKYFCRLSEWQLLIKSIVTYPGGDHAIIKMTTQTPHIFTRQDITHRAKRGWWYVALGKCPPPPPPHTHTDFQTLRCSENVI